MRVALRKHHKGRYRVASIDIPTYCGAIRITGVGDFFTDALGAAVKVASRITDDPIMMAIMPPQATVAIEAVRAISAASHAGPEGLAQAIQQYEGPGQRRLIAALAKEHGAPAVIRSAAASPDNAYRGVGPDPRAGVGAPPIATPGHGGVSVTDSNKGGGRITGPHARTPSRLTYGGKPVPTDQRSGPRQRIDEVQKQWGTATPDDPERGAQAATSDEQWKPGDFMPPPTPGRAMTEEYYQTLLKESQDPSNPYTTDPQYADFYAQMADDNADAPTDNGEGGGGAYAPPYSPERYQLEDDAMAKIQSQYDAEAAELTRADEDEDA